MTKLKRNGWINQTKDSYVCHQVIQEVIRKKLKPNVTKCKALIDAFNSLLSVNMNTGETGLNKKQYLVFGESISKSLKQAHVKTATLNHKIGWILLDLGEYSKSVEYNMKSIYIKEKLKQVNDISLAQSYTNTAVAYRRLGQLEKSKEYQLKGIVLKENNIEKQDFDLAISYDNLGLVLRDLNQFDEALNWHLKAISLLQTDEQHTFNLAACYNNLGITLEKMNANHESLKYLEESLKIWRKKVGENHPHVAATYNNMAMNYCKLQQYDLSIIYHQKAIAIRELVFDSTHPILSNSYLNISQIYYEISDINNAILFINKALNIRQSSSYNNPIELERALSWQKRIYEKLA